MCQDDFAVWNLEPYADFFFEAFLTIQKGWKFQLWVSTAEISCGAERYLSNQNYDSALFIVQWGLKLSWAKATDKVKYWDLLILGLADFKVPKTPNPVVRNQSQNQNITNPTDPKTKSQNPEEKLKIIRTTIIPSFPELWTVAPNHCFDLSSIMVPEALLFPAKIELKVHIFSQVKKQNLSIKKRDRSCTVNTFSIIPVYTVRGLETR